MARANERPTIDLLAGRAALEETLPRVLRFLNSDLEALGWRRPDDNTLLLPMCALAADASDRYLLRLYFRAGRDWPPSAQFVNPETLDYVWPAEQHYLPKLSSPEAQMHPNYAAPVGRPIQLICCSATFEFYDVLHSVEGRHLWRSTDTFYVTVDAIQRAMKSHYGGRYDRYGG